MTRRAETRALVYTAIVFVAVSAVLYAAVMAILLPIKWLLM